jgi:hypothetical protein
VAVVAESVKLATLVPLMFTQPLAVAVAELAILDGLIHRQLVDQVAVVLVQTIQVALVLLQL